MSKSMMAKAFALVALIALAAAPTFAQPISHDLVLKGRVAASTLFTMTPGTTEFDLSLSAVDELIASLFEKSNAPNGYTITLASLNAWKFVSADSNVADTVPYSLKYGVSGSEAALDLGSASVVLTDPIYRTQIDGVSTDLLISYTGDYYEASESYGDTLTFTLTVK